MRAQLVTRVDGEEGLSQSPSTAHAATRRDALSSRASRPHRRERAHGRDRSDGSSDDNRLTVCLVRRSSARHRRRAGALAPKVNVQNVEVTRPISACGASSCRSAVAGTARTSMPPARQERSERGRGAAREQADRRQPQRLHHRPAEKARAEAPAPAEPRRERRARDRADGGDAQAQPDVAAAERESCFR